MTTTARHRWMKFWPGDWQRDPALRMCGLTARGLWIECLALMHEATPYGHLLVNGRAPTPRQLAMVVGSTEAEVGALLGELEEAGVFSRTEAGVIFSRRMVRDWQQAEQGRVAVETRWNRARSQETPTGGGDAPPTRGGSRGPNSLEAEAEAEIDSSPSPDGEGVSSAGAAAAPGAASSNDPPAAPSDPQPGANKVPRQRPEIPEATLNALAAIWNDMAADIGLPQVSELTPKRRAALRARIVERWMKDPERQFRKYCRRISTSDFLTGQRHGSDWKASFDWAIKPGSPVAVAEGKYHDGEAG